MPAKRRSFDSLRYAPVAQDDSVWGITSSGWAICIAHPVAFPPKAGLPERLVLLLVHVHILGIDDAVVLFGFGGGFGCAGGCSRSCGGLRGGGFVDDLG